MAGGKGDKKLGGAMKKIGTTSSGKIIVEMSPEEWAKKNKIQSEFGTKDLSTLIKQYREENQVTQIAFARKAGVSRNTIVAVEGGRMVYYPTAQKILAAIIGDKAR